MNKKSDRILIAFLCVIYWKKCDVCSPQNRTANWFDCAFRLKTKNCIRFFLRLHNTLPKVWHRCTAAHTNKIFIFWLRIVTCWCSICGRRICMRVIERMQGLLSNCAWRWQCDVDLLRLLCVVAADTWHCTNAHCWRVDVVGTLASPPNIITQKKWMKKKRRRRQRRHNHRAKFIRVL